MPENKEAGACVRVQKALQEDSMRGKHVLVIDDEASMRSLLSEALSSAGFFVTTVTDAKQALALLADGTGTVAPVDVLLTDFNMPGLTGLELVDALRSEGAEMPCFLMSGNHDDTLAKQALARGCAGFLAKPFGLSVLVGRINEALEVQPARGSVRHCSA